MAERARTGRHTGRPPRAEAARAPREPEAPSPARPASPPAAGPSSIGTLREALEALASQSWITQGDIAAVALARIVAAAIEPAPSGQRDLLGGPLVVAADPKAVRELGPLLVGLITDLGGTPAARERLRITDPDPAEGGFGKHAPSPPARRR